MALLHLTVRSFEDEMSPWQVLARPALVSAGQWKPPPFLALVPGTLLLPGPWRCVSTGPGRPPAFSCLTTLLSLCRQDVATMQFCANKLDKKDFFGKSDPFLVFYRSNEDGT